MRGKSLNAETIGDHWRRRRHCVALSRVSCENRSAIGGAKRGMPASTTARVLALVVRSRAASRRRCAKVWSEAKASAITACDRKCDKDLFGRVDIPLKHYANTQGRSGQITVSLTSRINTRRPRDRSPAAERRFRSRSSAIMPQNHHAKVGRSTAPSRVCGFACRSAHAAPQPLFQAVSESRFPSLVGKSHGGQQW